MAENGDFFLFPEQYRPEMDLRVPLENEQQIRTEAERILNKLRPMLAEHLVARTETSLGQLEAHKLGDGVLVINKDEGQALHEVFWIEEDRIGEAHVRKRGPASTLEDLQAEEEIMLDLVAGNADWMFQDADGAKEIADYFDGLLPPGK